MAVDLYGNGFANALQGALGQMYGINQQNQDQSFANNYADAQFGAYRYGLDQNNAYKNKELDAQTAYLNAALQGNLGLGHDTLSSQTGLANRGLDLQGTLGNRNLDILSQEQQNKLAVANSRNAILEKLLGGFGSWMGGGQATTGGTAPTPGAPTGAPVGDASAPLGGAPNFSSAQYQSQPSGFTTNFGQRATYQPGQRQMYPQMRRQTA